VSIRLYIPRDSSSLSVGAEEVAVALQLALHSEDVSIIRNGSRGLYWLEPMIEVETLEGRVAYGPVQASDVSDLLEHGLINGEQSHPLCLGLTEEIPYLKKQQRLTFARAGIIDPVSLDDYLETDGYKGLKRAITMTPQELIDEIKESGLRGRGGAAFPTGIKWQTVLNAQANGPSAQKYIVCNADEGDSGTFADRLLMESDPYQLIEGMTIAGLAVGANQGYIYLRSEYPVAHKILNIAIERATDAGFLGANVAVGIQDPKIKAYLKALIESSDA
jgi:formate dehydrogenase iron-sulfur subunit